ncbi:MAG: anti-sigma factor antagonist [Acidobacteria bacterium]|nr:MAG: anti-sigma factor antagonist [Acidobacteriota bacterium]
MHVDVRKADDVIIVDLDGQLVSGIGDELLRDVMNELLAEGWSKILINLSQVERIDSAGIGELVAGSRLATRFGTSVRLLQVTGRVRQVLELGQVLPLFHVYDNEEEALAAFADDAAAAASGE